MPKENIWFCDNDGLGTPGYGLCMSAEDMAKIGYLKQVYEKEKEDIIVEDYLKESFK